MKFWVASAPVPPLMAEPTTRAVQALVLGDPDMLVWWGSRVECVSAPARLERETALAGRQAGEAYERLEELTHSWHEIAPSEIVRETAMRFLRVHPLAAADALQLVAAFVAAESRPSALEIVTLDDRLAEPARKVDFVLGVL